MALSMDEQRMLAEIERRLAAEDPALAARLSSFRRPGPKAILRSPKVRIVGSVVTVALVAVVSLVVYAMIPLRAHSTRMFTRPQASPAGAVLTVPNASVTSVTSAPRTGKTEATTGTSAPKASTNAKTARGTARAKS